MLYADNGEVTDPRFNLALEEYLLRDMRSDDSCLLFYINEPSIIIGRNQNTVEEINADVVTERGIHVVRRISGGGAVYHDLGNLNFSFIAPYAAERFNRYEEFTRPVVEVLRELGVPATLSGRNDIVVADGRKISGNAQFTTGRRMFSHGTVLFNTNLDDVTAALNVKPGKIESKGIKSVRSRVANITEFLSEPITIREFRALLLERIFDGQRQPPAYELTPEDLAAVAALVASRYGNWAWNYGESPPFNLRRSRRFPAGEIDMRIDAHQGCIEHVRFFGDFMGRADVAQLGDRLKGVRFERNAIAEALGGVDVHDYFGDIDAEQVLGVFCD